MKVGIGLPNAVRGVDRAGIVGWAQRAERAGFASLGTLDRLVYANYESLIALAAAAAVTERIELVTDILIAPLRSNTALLAKQAATRPRFSRRCPSRSRGYATGVAPWGRAVPRRGYGPIAPGWPGDPTPSKRLARAPAHWPATA